MVMNDAEVTANILDLYQMSCHQVNFQNLGTGLIFFMKHTVLPATILPSCGI